MPQVTRLVGGATGARIDVHLDGALWRALPRDVVLASGLAVGVELDRARLRRLRRELRRAEALEATARILARRDFSRASLERELEARDIARAEREAAVRAVERAGLVDDDRLARRRAAALAARGAGDDFVRLDLERRGFAEDAADRAVAALEPEVDRVKRIVATRGGGARTARYLAASGFAADSIAAAVSEIVAEDA